MAKKQDTAPAAPAPADTVEREVIEHKVTVLNTEIETKPAYSDPVRLREFRAIQATTPQPSYRNPREQRFSNLPTPGKFSAQMNDAVAQAERDAERRAAEKAAFANRKWMMFGVQPTERGFTLHTWHYEGDRKVKETVNKGLTMLGAREQFALLMSAFWAKFGS